MLMDAFNNSSYLTSSWLHGLDAQPSQDSTVNVSSSSNSHSHSPDVNVNEWAGAARSSSHTPMDMSMSGQQFTLGDLQGSAPSSSSSMTPAQSFYYSASLPQSNLSLYSPFSNFSYGQNWAQQSLPLTSFSTLNGATSNMGQSMPPAPPLSSASMDSLMIDPSLTVNGGTSNGSLSYTRPSSSSSQSQQESLQLRSQQGHLSSLPLSINPMYVNPSSGSSSQNQQQHSLSPSLLHSHSTTPTQMHPHTQIPYMSSLMPPSMFYAPQQLHGSHSDFNTSSGASPSPSPASTLSSTTAATSTSSTMTATDDNFLASFRKLLSPAALSGSGGASADATTKGLVSLLSIYIPPSSSSSPTSSAMRGAVAVPPDLRLEIITKIRDNGGNAFFKAWAENADAMDVIREWLKAAATGKDEGLWGETVMPLLHVIDRLPLTLEMLKVSKLGRIIMKLMKEPPSPAVKDMASNIERKWRQLLSSVGDGGSTGGEKPRVTVSIEDKTKKRKLEGSTNKAAPPAKRPAIGTSTSSTSSIPSAGTTAPAPLQRATVKKEPKVVVTAVKDAKADSSFFSAPKPKPKLPSFKKAPPITSSTSGMGVVVKKEPDVNISQPNVALDPFQEALRSMGKTRTASPALSAGTPPKVSTPTGAGASITAANMTAITKSLKKRKSVTWATEDKLEQVKLIERAVYDDDELDESGSLTTTHTVRDLDRGEGRALHAHLFEEIIDWSEPLPLEIPGNLQRGINSTEKDAQEEREKSSLGALYVSAAQIPDSPAEPSSQISLEDVDLNAKTMLAGSDIQPFFNNAMSVTELVGQLKSFDAPPLGMQDVQMHMSDPSMNASVPAAGSIDLRGLGFDPTALTALTQQLGLIGQQQNNYDPIKTWDIIQQQIQQNLQQQNQLPPPAGYFADTFNNGFDDESGPGSSRGKRERASDNGWGERGGRGRGRGRGRGGHSDGSRSKRKPCIFFQAGRCKYGDQCDFSHEPIY